MNKITSKYLDKQVLYVFDKIYANKKGPMADIHWNTRHSWFDRKAICNAIECSYRGKFTPMMIT